MKFSVDTCPDSVRVQKPSLDYLSGVKLQSVLVRGTSRGPPVQRSSCQSGLKSGTLVTSSRGRVSFRGTQQGGGFCALPSGADPRTEQQTKGTDPRNRHPQNGQVKLFPADRGHHIPAPKPCFACWSLWLAGPWSPVPLLLLVVSLLVPCFFGCVSSSCFLADRGRRPRNRAFLSGTLRNLLQWWLLGRRCTLLLGKDFHRQGIR